MNNEQLKCIHCGRYMSRNGRVENCFNLVNNKIEIANVCPVCVNLPVNIVAVEEKDGRVIIKVKLGDK